MATNYPSGIDSLTNPSAGDALTSPSHSAQHAMPTTPSEAIETELGTTPSGSETTVAARLTAIESGARMGTGSIGATALADNAVDTRRHSGRRGHPGETRHVGALHVPDRRLRTATASPLARLTCPAPAPLKGRHRRAGFDVVADRRHHRREGLDLVDPSHRTGNTGWVAGRRRIPGWRDQRRCITRHWIGRACPPAPTSVIRRFGPPCRLAPGSLGRCYRSSTCRFPHWQQGQRRESSF